MMKGLELAKSIAAHASKAKAIDLRILDLKDLSGFTDFFVIASATSDRQMRAICDRVVGELKKENIRSLSVEGYEYGQWILADFADVILHVFTEESRRHYDLEGFWFRARRVPFRSESRAAAPRKKAAKKRKIPKART
jgi:ribosome-associated protein